MADLNTERASHPEDHAWERWIAGLDQDPASAAEMAAHYDSCAPCRERCEELRRQLLDWADVRSPVAEEPGMDCPDLEAMMVATRQTPIPADLAAHIATCGRCAALLLELLRSRQENEEPAPPGDAPMSMERRRQLASLLAVQTKPGAPEPRRALRFPYWAATAAAAVIIVAGVSFVTLQRSRPPLPLLAQAYSSQRTIEMRIPGAAHATVALRRGAGAGASSPELLEADARIARGIRSYPSSPEWWHAKARSELLHGRLDQAIQSFQGARSLGAGSAQFLNDFGAAYFERAEERKSPIDYTQAVELLSEALRQEPALTATLYNRALAYARQSLLDAAIRDLEACIAAEKDDAWKREAQSRLDDLRKLRGVLPRPPSPPASAEEHLDEALRNGLPPGPALDAAAADLRKLHGDPWLQEALAHRPAPAILHSLSHLARLRARTRSHEDPWPRIAALRAARLDAPYQAWRDFEILFQAAHSKGSTGCDTAQWNFQERYPWFAAQVRLEQSGCAANAGDLDRSRALVADARRIASQNHFQLAGYRAEGYRTSRLVTEGRYREALEAAGVVLAQMQLTPVPARRAHQFFNDVARASESLERWNNAAAAYEMSAETASLADMPVLESLAWFRRGDALLRAGLTAHAEENYKRAESHARDSMPAGDARFFHAFARAGLLAARNDYQALADLRSDLPAGNLYFQAPYWVALARQAARRGLWTDAEAHADAALAAILSPHNPSARPSLFRRDHESASIERVRAQWMQGRTQEALKSWREFLRRDYALLHGAPLESAASSPPQGVVRLTIAALEPDLVVWAESASNLTASIQADGAPKARSLARRITRLAAEPWTDPAHIQQTARQLAAELIEKPLAAHPKPRQVSIEARGELAAIPYRLLLDATSIAAGADVAIAPWPGERPKTACVPSSEGAFARADLIHPRFQAILPRLPGLLTETEHAMRAANGGTILSGSQATPALLASAAAKARRFHFAGHALPWKGGVALVAAPDAAGPTEEERLGLWQLDPAQPFCAEVAFFAACSTGRYEPSESVAADLLAEAALAGGVRSVVASLWDVDSASAAQLSAAFYESLRAGHSARAALHLATRKLREAGPAHPYYWAAFALFETQGER